MARQVPDIIFQMTELKLERIIAEIVDNTLDAEAKEVEVKFFGIDKDESDVGFIVLDNGTGFEDTDELFDSWEIEKKTKTRSEDEVGKYHVGMKIAPLTKYKTIFIVTIIDGVAWISRAFNASRTGKPFDMDNKAHENPTKPEEYDLSDTSIPSYVHDQIKDFATPKTCEWTTGFVAVDKWRDLLDDGFDAYSSIIDKNHFQKHMVQFLGMTYQHYFEDDDDLEINVDNLIVAPLDPFWTDYTPSRFNSELVNLESKMKVEKDKDEQKAIAGIIEFNKAMSKFGTFQGKTYKSSVIDGLEITPYVIPQREARTIISQKVSSGWSDEDTKPWNRQQKNAPSELLVSNSACGFFFYRGKRLITFGHFYRLNIMSNDANQIRIKVKFPSNAEPDSFEVAPNKQRMDYISKEAWEEIFDAFGMKSGSNDWAEPFNQKAPFFRDTEEARKNPLRKNRTGGIFEHNPKAHYPNILVRNSEDWIKYRKCPKPPAGCGFLHEYSDICPKAPCPICSKTDKGCVPGTSCTFKCPYCKKVGDHIGIKCPDYCDKCKKSHDGKKCPKSKNCKTCKKVLESCTCPCNICREAKPCSGCCKVCKKLKADCDCQKFNNTIVQSGNKIILKLFSYNKSDTILKLKEVMKEHGITLSDLK